MNTHDTIIQNISLLLLRVLGSGIFIVAGIGHLFNTSSTATRLENAPLGNLVTTIAPSEILVIITGILLLTGGMMLLAGYRTRFASLLLISLLIPITLTIQIGSIESIGPLFKNISIMGILIFLAVNGSSVYSIDSWRQTGNNPAIRRAGSLILLWAAFPFLFAPISTLTAANIQYDNSYAVLISRPGHMNAAVHTAKTLDERYDFEEFVVVACGESVGAFIEGSDMADVYKEAEETGVTFVICGMSLENFNIDPDTLFDSVEIVPNGLTYLFELKQRGFMTVEL